MAPRPISSTLRRSLIYSCYAEKSLGCADLLTTYAMKVHYMTWPLWVWPWIDLQESVNTYSVLVFKKCQFVSSQQRPWEAYGRNKTSPLGTWESSEPYFSHSPNTGSQESTMHIGHYEVYPNEQQSWWPWIRAQCTLDELSPCTPVVMLLINVALEFECDYLVAASLGTAGIKCPDQSGHILCLLLNEPNIF